MRTPADRAHRASSRKYPSVRESLACRSCQTAYCRIATPGIPPPRVTSPHGAQAQSDSLVVANVLTLRYPYEVRDEKPYFEDIPDLKLSKEMLDLAAHIVQTKSGHFDPTRSVACVKEKLATC